MSGGPRAGIRGHYVRLTATTSVRLLPLGARTLASLELEAQFLKLQTLEGADAVWQEALPEAGAVTPVEARAPYDPHWVLHREPEGAAALEGWLRAGR